MIELLVVIAVIAILAALLLAVLGRALAAADSAVCRSNLHQIGLGFRMYVDDFHFYPTTSFWTVELVPYVREPLPQGNAFSIQGSRTNVLVVSRKSVWVCPGYNRINGVVSGGPWARPRLPGLGSSTSYGYNTDGIVTWYSAYYRFGLGCEDPVGRPVREQEVLSPADMIEAGDGVLLGLNYFFCGRPALGAAQICYGTWHHISDELMGGHPHLWPDAPGVRALPGRHGGRWNVLFCDEHIENLRTRNLFDIHSPAQMRRFNRDNKPHMDLFVPPR